jgi:predicted DNA binding CopG/RHH family protein
MVKKRPSLSEEIARNMENRDIADPTADIADVEVTPVTQKATTEARKATTGYKNTVISVRFDEGDYERLKQIAREQGPNGAALIRKAVKDIIREADGI